MEALDLKDQLEQEENPAQLEFQEVLEHLETKVQ